jgi:hypothetical protein
VRKLKQTKRDRQQVIQAWLDPFNPDEKAVLTAVEKLREKHSISAKQVIMKSILWAAEQDGIEVDRPVSMAQITKMFKKIMGALENMVANGQMTSAQASEISQMFESEVRFEELDPLSRSLAGNYTGFDLNEDDE